MGNVGFEFLQDMKKAGKTKHIGFSFHDSSEVLDRILTEHPEVEYVQLQLNYIDWTSDFVQSGKCYEVCPQNIPISTYMKLYNEHYKMDCYTNGMVYYNNITAKHPKASACIKCGKCNQVIDNKKNIMEYIEKCVKSFEF